MRQALINKTVIHLKKQYSGETSGHDWWHLYRVWQVAKYIASKEKNINQEIVELAALLHDVGDYKFHGGSKEKGAKAVYKLMQDLGYPKSIIDQVLPIVTNISYLGAKIADNQPTQEGKIVQDADRLDATGAIGIARCFAWGGQEHTAIHDPSLKPVLHQDEGAYMAARGSSINHFYEKLLFLKDRMHTKIGKKLAIKRHKYMQDFLKKFYAEWDGKE